MSLCIFLLSGALAFPIYGQATTGSLIGTITDQSGAVISGATVTTRNKATGASRTTTSSEQGNYEITLLQPGEYEVTIEAQGFSKAVQESVTVNISARVTSNITLKPGDTTEIVTVSGEIGAAIETTETTIKGVVDNRQIRDLPLTGRNFASLAVLVPGAKPAEPFDPTKARIGTVSFSGSSGRDANVTIDGADNKDNAVGGAVQNYTSEGIQEFVVNTQSFLPENGRSAGGAVNVITKSGGAEYHGGFVGFFRNDRFNARAFNNQSPSQKQPFDRQNLAGSFGGPILPSLKDKLFFFGAFEYTRENISTIVDPAAVGELQALNRFAQQGLIPGVSSVGAQSLIPTPFRDTQFQVRGDYRADARNTLTFRYAQQDNDLDNDQLGTTADVTQGAQTTNKLRSALLTHNFTVTNSVVNVFSFQYSKFINRIGAKSEAPSLIFPTASFGRNVNIPQTTQQGKFQFRDGLSYSVGKHSLKFGVDYVYTPILNGSFDFNSAPEVDFNVNPSAIGTVQSNGRTIIDPSTIDTILVSSGVSYIAQKINQVSFYAQDSFRLTSRFTINYGVRYDADFGFYNRKDGSQATNRGVQLLQQIGVYGPGGQALPDNDKNNISPRVGLAYDLRGDGKMVLRASYGLFYDQIFQNVGYFGIQQSNPDIYFSQITNNNGDPNGFRLGIDPLPVRTTSAANFPTLAGTSSRLRTIDPNVKTPYTQQTSVNYQYEFRPGYIFNVNYIHILGLNQFVTLELNPRVGALNPNFIVGTPASQNPRVLDARFQAIGLGSEAIGRISQASSVNRSRYDGFTIGVNRRYSGASRFKYQYNLNYTLSRALTYGAPGQGAAINDFGTTFENPFQYLRPIDLTRSGADARHRFVVNGILDMPFGFQVSTILQAESARPFDVFAQRDLNGDGRAFDIARLDANGNFLTTPSGSVATGQLAGINPGRGKPYFQTDLRVTKTINIKERVRILGFAEFFNLFNRANVGNVFNGSTNTATNIRSLTPTGLLGSSFGGLGTSIGTPFQMQLGFRIGF